MITKGVNLELKLLHLQFGAEILSLSSFTITKIIRTHLFTILLLLIHKMSREVFFPAKGARPD